MNQLHVTKKKKMLISDRDNVQILIAPHHVWIITLIAVSRLDQLN